MCWDSSYCIFASLSLETFVAHKKKALLVVFSIRKKPLVKVISQGVGMYNHLLFLENLYDLLQLVFTSLMICLRSCSTYIQGVSASVG